MMKNKKKTGATDAEEATDATETNDATAQVEELEDTERNLAEEIAEETKEGGDEVERLGSALEAMSKEAEENLNKFLRKTADFENFRKRMEKEQEAHRNYAGEAVISALLTPIDHLEMALGHAEERDDEDEGFIALRDGIKLTLAEVYGELGKFGLNDIKAKGERFDPTVHEAIGHEEAEGVESDIVVKVLRKGFTLKGRLLRPAMVMVSKGGDAAKDD